MKLTKAQKEFLENLKELNTAGGAPMSCSWPQTRYLYEVYPHDRLPPKAASCMTLGLVRDCGSSRVHAPVITEDGLRAL